MKKNAGYSLIEVIVSLSVFILVISFLITTFPSTMRSVDQGKDYVLAAQIAKQELEFVSQLPWDEQVNTNPALQTRSTSLIVRTKSAAAEKTFYSDFDVQPLAEDPTSVKVVKVKIYWDVGKLSTGTGEREVVVETMTFSGN